jgi:hypothetical protein
LTWGTANFINSSSDHFSHSSYSGRDHRTYEQQVWARWTAAPSPLAIAIDIKPRSDRNSVNPFSRGVIRVAILGSDTFDVADVDVTTLAFGPSAASPAHNAGGHWEDVNDDGFTDLLSHYRTEETGIAVGDEEACVSGVTLDYLTFEGCDTVETFSPPGIEDENGSLITPIAVEGVQTSHTYNVNNLINESGLIGDQHNDFWINMWLCYKASDVCTLTFDLGGLFDLESAHVWQFNTICCYSNRGVRDFSILASIDGVNFDLVTEAFLDREEGGWIDAQEVVLGISARYIRFDIHSNYGDASYVGLSEVKFRGNAIPVDVGIDIKPGSDRNSVNPFSR